MVAGRLQEKNGYFYIVLSYKDSSGKRKEPWFKTGLKVKGNKRLAEQMLLEYRTNFNTITGRLKSQEKEEQKSPLLFGDYISSWLEKRKHEISPTTYVGYHYSINKIIKPYFNEKGILLESITPADIEQFYRNTMSGDEYHQGVTGKTAIHYHAYIRKCLQDAFKEGLISYNPADLAKRPIAEEYIANYYNIDEIKTMLKAVKGTPIEFACHMASYYGLRRSEIVGLKWSAFDFTYNTVTIRHTISSATIDGKYQIIAQDRTKTKKSYRTLPISQELKDLLFKMKREQEENKKFFGNAYNHTYDEYVYVNKQGDLIRPDFISQNFPIVLRNNHLKKIRFHDLRHSCATMLRHLGVRMEDIQQYLGHSNIVTTQKIYAHFEQEQNARSLELIVEALAENEKSDFEM